MPRAEIYDGNHRSLGYIDLPDTRPSGPTHPVTALLSLLFGAWMIVLIVLAANEPNPGEPGYCRSGDEVLVGHNSLGIPKYACVDEVPQ